MRSLFPTVRDLNSGRGILRKHAYGMIEVAAGRLVRIQLKPWPKIASVVEARWISGWKKPWGAIDSCRLYYNQPLQHRNFLALTYIESSIATRANTVIRSLQILDQIASIKQTDAILAQLSNNKISDRLMERLGWERHLHQQRRRQWIKRFYGEYPDEISHRENDFELRELESTSQSSNPFPLQKKAI